MQGTATLNLLASELRQTPLWEQAIVPIYISAIKLLSSKLNADGGEFTPFSGALMHAMLQSIAQTESSDLVKEAQLALTQGPDAMFRDEFTAPVQTYLGILARDPLPGKLGLKILACAMTAIYAELKRPNLDEKSVLLALALLFQAYKVRADFTVRVAMLRPFFTLLFTTMQDQKLSGQARNQSVDIFYQVF